MEKVDERDERGELDPKVAAMLGPALEAFGRLGYRRCSMAAVAQAAGVSRAWLYLYFANKEEVFRAAVEHALEGRLRAAGAALVAGSLEVGLVGALVAWADLDAGLMGAETDELVLTARRMVGGVVEAFEGRLEAMLGGAIAGSEVGAAYARADVAGRELARMLYAMARGVRERARTAEGFRREMGVAVRVLWAVGRG